MQMPRESGCKTPAARLRLKDSRCKTLASLVEAMLLESAINLFIKAERTHDVEQKVRATNAAARLFFALHKSHRKPAPPPPSLGELGL
jgi:hypothetical protein